MQTKVQLEKANAAAVEMLELSRTVRRYREEVGDVLRQLLGLSELEECRMALRRQEDNLSVITAQMTSMSSALNEIAAAYALAEERNLRRLEERHRSSFQDPGNMVVYGTGSLQSRIQEILYK